MFLLLFYFLSVLRTCPNSDKFCASCDSETNKCLLCIKSFPNEKGVCIPPQNEVNKCLSYKKDGQCQLCGFGYYTNPYGKCVEISTKNCLEVENSSECGICEQGYLPEDGKCTKKNKCVTENCQLCYYDKINQQEICALCESGYAVLLGKEKSFCMTEKESIKNCLFINSADEKKCSTCDLNYYWVDHSCKKTTAYTLITLETIGIMRIMIGIFILWFNQFFQKNKIRMECHHYLPEELDGFSQTSFQISFFVKSGIQQS